MSKGLTWLRQSSLRFWLPNLVTSASVTFGFLSILSSAANSPINAAWFILFCTLADKLDGSVARVVHGNSNFGVQLDSFADFLGFGIAPGALVFSFFAHHPELGYAEGWPRALLYASVVFYVLCVCFRLARFNVTTMPAWAPRIFFGIPTTVIGGTMGALFLTLLKYGDASEGFRATLPHDVRPLGDLSLGVLSLKAFPIYMIIGALLMVSTLRVPKLGKTPWKLANIAILLLTVFAYVVGPWRILPEYLLFYALLTIVISFVYHAMAPHARKVAPPPLFLGGEAGERVVMRRARFLRRERRRRHKGGGDHPGATGTS